MKTTEQKECIKDLRKLIKAGNTVYTILRHVSSSGMTRHIDLLVMKKNQPHRITWSAAKAMGYRMKDGSIVTQGCGMDMGFDLVYNLSRTLFPKGFKVKGMGRNGDTSGHDKDGGYALNHRWL